jgi:hypothetical protein
MEDHNRRTAPLASDTTAAGTKLALPWKLVIVAAQAACLFTCLVQPVGAGPLEDAKAALSRGDPATAQRIYRSLADQGNITAITQLGMIYLTGPGVPRDYRAAFNWLNRAAALGSAEAQYQVGDMHLRGLGTQQDLLQAARAYSRAAEQGHAAAQYVLGVLYKLGGGVHKNYRKAARWFSRSAAQGVPEAQSELGQLYASGSGVPNDKVAAYKWLTLARGPASSSRTRAEAAAVLRRLESRMSPAETTEALKQARAWRAVPEG